MRPAIQMANEKFGTDDASCEWLMKGFEWMMPAVRMTRIFSEWMIQSI